MMPRLDGFETCARIRQLPGGALVPILVSIARQLAQLMDGTIEVESQSGVGSTFTFVARLRKQPQIRRRAPASRGDLRGLRALIVDDNATNREILVQ